jgi:hypothetical protein
VRRTGRKIDKPKETRLDLVDRLGALVLPIESDEASDLTVPDTVEQRA